MIKSDEILDDSFSNQFDPVIEAEGLKIFGSEHLFCVSKSCLLIFLNEISIDGYIRKVPLVDIVKINYLKRRKDFWLSRILTVLIVLPQAILFEGAYIDLIKERLDNRLKLKYMVEDEKVTSIFTTTFQDGNLKEIDQLIITNLNKTD